MKNNLKDGLMTVERASGENLNLPILKYAIFEAQDDKIKITATNLEIAICYLLAGKIIEKGKISVPIATFLNLINNIQSEIINLERRGGKLEIKTDNYEAGIQFLPTDDFPIIPKIKNETEWIEIEGGIFKDALESVLAAAQFSDLRADLNNILLDFSLDSFKLVATDSFRLAEKTINGSFFKANYKDEFKILIPLKTSQDLIRLIKDGEVIKIYKDQNQILFKTERMEFISRLSDAVFPEYSPIIPKDFEAEVVVNREELLTALKVTSVFSGSGNEIKIKIPESKKVMEIFSATQELGENKYILSVKSNKQLLEPIGFNWKYFSDALKVLKTEEVFIGINEDNKPAVIKSVNEGSYFYILMPILKT